MGLQYEEYNESGSGKRKIELELVSPVDSGTIIRQNQILDPIGLTLVAIIEKDRYIFTDVFKKISDLDSFKEAPNLHLTMLGLFDGKTKSNTIYEGLTIKRIEEYFRLNPVGKFRIKFDKVRFGARYYEENDKYGNRQQMNKQSNGTVFANGNMLQSDSVKFNKVGSSLSKWLISEPKLSNIFPSNFGRKFNALWCRLGYFTNDFRITDKIEPIFLSDELFKFDSSLSIEKLSIVKYKTRDLKEAEEVSEIILQ